MSRKLLVGTIVATGLLMTVWQSPLDAQARRRAPSSGGGRPQARAVERSRGPARISMPARVHVGGYFGYRSYRPYYYYPWIGWGLGWGVSPYFYYPPYPYYYYGHSAASVRVQFEPKSAEVYVDGHLAGMVDEFDGFFQSLQVEPGGREVTVYKEGFRPYTDRLYLRPGHRFTMKGHLEPLAPGEPNPPRPVSSAPVQQYDPAREPGFDPSGVPAQIGRPGNEPLPPVAGDPGVAIPSNFGQLAIRVQPADAEVLIDDEPWKGPQGAERLVVHLPPGTHRVEIRKEGFDSFVTSVDLRKGETTVLNVSLGRVQ